MRDDQIPVPQRLTKPSPFVTATRTATAGLRAGPDRRLELRRKGVVRLAVSRDALPRALRLLQAVFGEAERRGWQVEAVESAYGEGEGVAIVVDGHSYCVEVSEQTDRVPLSEPEVAAWRRANEWRIKWDTTDDPIGLVESHVCPVKSYGDVAREYAAHPEAKFLACTGDPCLRSTSGTLRRRKVTASLPEYLGKEGNLLGRRAEFAGAAEAVQQVYQAEEEWQTTILPRLRRMDRQELASAAGLSARARYVTCSRSDLYRGVAIASSSRELP